MHATDSTAVKPVNIRWDTGVLHKLRKLAVVHRASPLNLAGHAVVPNLLSQVGDGLLQTHVEAQALAEVVPHLQEQGHFAPHAACCPLHIIHLASLANRSLSLSLVNRPPWTHTTNHVC